jgi:PhnB protein
MGFKPDRYPSLSPYLVVRDAQVVIDFVTATFDATTLRRHEREDGSVQHAELQVDDSVVMLGQAVEGWPAVSCHMHVYVPDVDETYSKALAAGGESIQAPEKRDDPDRRSGVRGPGGNTWWISTRVG